MKFLTTKYVRYAGAITATATILFARTVLAQDTVREGLYRAGLSRFFPDLRFNGISGFLAFLIELLLFAAGGVAVLFIIIGGFQYITSAGNAEGATKGKKTVVNAVIGLVIIILSYLIISVIIETLLGGSFFTS